VTVKREEVPSPAAWLIRTGRATQKMQSTARANPAQAVMTCGLKHDAETTSARPTAPINNADYQRARHAPGRDDAGTRFVCFPNHGRTFRPILTILRNRAVRVALGRYQRGDLGGTAKSGPPEEMKPQVQFVVLIATEAFIEHSCVPGGDCGQQP